MFSLCFQFKWDLEKRFELTANLASMQAPAPTPNPITLRNLQRKQSEGQNRDKSQYVV